MQRYKLSTAQRPKTLSTALNTTRSESQMFTVVHFGSCCGRVQQINAYKTKYRIQNFGLKNCPNY